MIKSPSVSNHTANIKSQITSLVEFFKKQGLNAGRALSQKQLSDLDIKIQEFNELGLRLCEIADLQNMHNDVDVFMEVCCSYNIQYLNAIPKEKVNSTQSIQANLKILAKMAEFYLDKPEAMARNILSHISLIMCLYLRIKMDQVIAAHDSVKIFDCAHQLVLWLGNINHISLKLKDLSYERTTATSGTIKDILFNKAYFGLISYYADQGKINDVLRLFDVVLKRNTIYDLNLLVILTKLFINSEINNKKALRLLGLKIKTYIENNREPLSAKAKSQNALVLCAIETITKEDGDDIVKNITTLLTAQPSLHLSTKYYEDKDCLQVKLSATLPKGVVESCLRKLPTALVKYRHDKGDLLIYRIWELNADEISQALIRINNLIARQPIQSAIDDCYRQLKLLRLSLTTMPATRIENDSKLNDIIQASSNMHKRKGTKKAKKKIAAAPAIKQETPSIPTTLARNLTAHDIGFHRHDPDFQIFPLSAGEHIPGGIYYTYGIKLEKSERAVSEQEIIEYQQILEEGQIVTPGRRGLRIVKPKESGMAHQVLFKITHPRRDLRILLVPDETIVDENGQEKHLYRAGIPKFHK